MLALGTLGAALALLVLLADKRSRSFDPPYADTAEFILWLFVTCLEAAIWAVLFVPLVRWLRELGPYGKGHLRSITASALLLGVLIGIFIYLSSSKTIDLDQIPYLDTKIVALSPIPLVLAVGGAVAVWLIDAALRDFPRRSADPREELRQLLWLRERLNSLLAFEATILAASILGTVTLRNAVKAADLHIDFPATLVLVHGLFFSGLLAIGYTPVHLRMAATTRRLRDRVYPMPHPDSPQWTSWWERRSAFEKLTQTEAGSNPTLRAVAAVLSPAATAALAFVQFPGA